MIAVKDINVFLQAIGRTSKRRPIWNGIIEEKLW